MCLTYWDAQSARDSPQHVFFSCFDLAVQTNQSVRHFVCAIYETKYQASYARVLDKCTVKLLITRNLRVWTEVFQTGCSHRASADYSVSVPPEKIIGLFRSSQMLENFGAWRIHAPFMNFYEGNKRMCDLSKGWLKCVYRSELSVFKTYWCYEVLSDFVYEIEGIFAITDLILSGLNLSNIQSCRGEIIC